MRWWASFGAMGQNVKEDFLLDYFVIEVAGIAMINKVLYSSWTQYGFIRRVSFFLCFHVKTADRVQNL